MALANSSEDGREGTSSQYHFVNRVASINSVHFLCFATAECYSALKKRSALAAITLGAVEKCASHAYARLGKPAVEQLSGPLQVADNLACKVLNKLENSYPVMSKTPQEIIADARDLGKRKYSEGQAYAQEKIDVCRDLLERAFNAACHPVDTAVSIARCTHASLWHQLTVAKSGCDQVIKSMELDAAPEDDPRNSTLPRLLAVSWKASVCLSHYVNAERQRCRKLIEETFAAATRILERPAEPLHEPTTASEHAGPGFHHVIKLCGELRRAYVDAFVLLYRTAWSWLSAQFSRTEPINLELLYDGEPSSTEIITSPPRHTIAADYGGLDDSEDSSDGDLYVYY
ncbi:uncharacterized protein LOC142559559 [Dermacentor variabilis]|uniref:uncharacterized protein LOC142559559 n=1 Tax=Dermacentor variabilis TaxID=34621 RepID=UPI003F5B5E0A